MTHQQTSTALLTLCPITSTNRSTWSGGGQGTLWWWWHHPRCTSTTPLSQQREDCLIEKCLRWEKHKWNKRCQRKEFWQLMHLRCRSKKSRKKKQREKKRERNWIQFFPPLNPSPAEPALLWVPPPFILAGGHIRGEKERKMKQKEAQEEEAVDVQLSRAASQASQLNSIRRSSHITQWVRGRWLHLPSVPSPSSLTNTFPLSLSLFLFLFLPVVCAEDTHTDFAVQGWNL